jgi:hypothetical protein
VFSIIVNDNVILYAAFDGNTEWERIGYLIALHSIGPTKSDVPFFRVESVISIEFPITIGASLANVLANKLVSGATYQQCQDKEKQCY